MTKLKVFRTRSGFYDAVVAVPSKKAALQAWGATQDLFRFGFAAPTSDDEAVTAALAKPGVVLRRAFGTNNSFSENPALPAPPKIPPSALKRAKILKQQRAREHAQDQHDVRLQKQMAEKLSSLEKRKTAISLEETRIRKQFERRKAR